MARGTGTSDPRRGARRARPTKTTRRRPRRPVGRLVRWHRAGRQDPVKGLTFERRWTTPGIHPYDEITWEYRTAGISSETGKSVFEQKDVEVPDFWSQLGHQRRRQQVLPRPPRHAGARDQRQAAHRSRGQHDHRVGRDPALLRDGRGPRDLQGRADPPPRPPEDGLQLAGLVQRRHRGAAAVQRLLHQLGPGHDVLDHGPGQDRGHALQVRLRRGQQPEHHPLLPREDDRRRHGLRPGQLHEGLRRLRRRREVGRQDPPRGQDGHPRRRPSGRPRLRRLEAQRGEEGLGPHRAGLRRQLHR